MTAEKDRHVVGRKNNSCLLDVLKKRASQCGSLEIYTCHLSALLMLNMWGLACSSVSSMSHLFSDSFSSQQAAWQETLICVIFVRPSP